MIETSIFSCKCACHILQTLSVVHTCSLAPHCCCKHSVPILLTIYSIIGLYTRTLKKWVKMFHRYNKIRKFTKMLSEKMLTALQSTLFFFCLLVCCCKGPTAKCFLLFSYLKSGAASIGVVCDCQNKEAPCCQMLLACYLLPLILPVSELNNSRRTRHGCFPRAVLFLL